MTTNAPFNAPSRAPWWRGPAWLGLGFMLTSPLAALNPDRKADSYSIQGWFTEQGLPSNKIRAVTQARDGYLWLATAQGIARFDGSRFTVFNGATNPELRGGGFFAVVEAPDGALWFGGDNGLFRWRNGQFDRFTTADGLAHNYVRALALTRDGAIVACTRAGYSFMRAGRITTPGGIWKKITGVTRSFLARADGSILLGTDDGLWRISGETITRLSGAARWAGNAFTCLLETPDGSLWIGYSHGVRCLHPDGTTEDYGVPQGLDKLRASALRFDRDGNLWIATYGDLYRLAHGRIESANYAGQLVGTTIQQLHEDREGGLWVATATGLFHLKDNVSTSIGSAKGLAQTAAYAVFEARDGAWWIGLWGGGVYRYDQTRATRLAVPAALGLDQVLAFAEEPAGTLWIGCSSGLYRHAAGATVNLHQRDQAAAWQKQLAERPGSTVPGPAHPRVNSIAADGEGGLWVATDGALYHGRDGSFRAYTTADGLPGNVFKSVIRARNGDIWITAPPFGASRLHEGQWTHYRCGQAIADIFPRAVYEDSAGSIWVTTEGGGLNRFKEGKWRLFTTRDGLADDFISGMTEDKLGNFWIAGPRGITRIPHAEFEELNAGRRIVLEPRIFNRFDGLPVGETNQQGSPNAWQARDGRLLFATDSGVAVVQPANLKINSLVPPIHLERMVVNGTDADLSRPVAVPPGVNDVEIYYTAISLLAPEKVRFKIRLAPLDRDWVDARERREVRYDKLPPGAYEFRVIACNNDGVWNETVVTQAFTVRPFFYQTGWFVGLVVATGVGGALGLYRARVRQARRQVTVLAGLVEARTHELQEENAERKRAETELANSLSVLHATLESTIDGMLVVDVKGKVTTFNRTFTEMWRLPRETVAVRDNVRSRMLGFDQLKDPRAFKKRVLKLLAQPEANSFDVLELKDARVIESYSQPQRVGQTIVGRVWCFRDITERKEAEAKLADTHRQLLDTSRQAGMAEVATGVLHNVGNVLNSVNVSATLVSDHVRHSKSAGIAKLAALFDEHRADLAAFLTMDPRGRMIPAYLATLRESLGEEQKTVTTELDHLRKNIEHIKDIVAMQQSYAKNSGFIETMALADLVEDAMRMNASSLVRHDVELVREFEIRPAISTDRHKVAQILINLVRNAKFACDETGRPDKRITVRLTGDGPRVRISVSDNGIGIPAENLLRIFNHGFTTKKDGHGFGLHSGALAAKELGGSLTVQSEGPGLGAAFILELPLRATTPPL